MGVEMFSNNDNQQTAAGTPPAQNPSMLDNVHVPAIPDPVATTPTPAVQQTPAAPTVLPPKPQDNNTQPEHTMTTDNPFAPSPVSPSPTTSVPMPEPVVGTTPAVMPVADDSEHTADEETPNTIGIQPSGPVIPPATTATNADSSEDGDKEEKGMPLIDTDKLADMKKQALDHLEPLVKHLDGTPEDTFKTAMMMIQANDNHTLLNKAFEAAKNISDDRERAQALLDIVNEINYFSQNSLDD